MSKAAWVLILLLPALGSGCAMGRVERDPSEIALGERAPEFALTTSRGEVVNSTELRGADDSLLIVFYRTRW